MKEAGGAHNIPITLLQINSVKFAYATKMKEDNKKEEEKWKAEVEDELEEAGKSWQKKQDDLDNKIKVVQ